MTSFYIIEISNKSVDGEMFLRNIISSKLYYVATDGITS